MQPKPGRRLARPLRRLLDAGIGAIAAVPLRGPVQPVPTELTWPLDEPDSARVTVHWPETYGWAEATRWVGPVRHGMSRFVRVVVDRIPQRHPGIVELRAEVDGRLHDVIIDYSDYPEYSRELLDRTALYFKMQCPPDADPRIVPGGYIPGSERIYGYLPRLRALRDQQAFAFDVYGRFSRGYATEVRRTAIALLTGQERFSYVGGTNTTSYPRYLREIARSRICIDLPGNGALCFRQIDYLAIGACVIGPRPPVILPVGLQDGVEIVYTKPDLSDLLERCDQYLNDGEACERIAANARAYFDRCLDRTQLGGYYLSTMLGRLA